MTDQEEWRAIPGYNGEYLISTHYRVKSLKHGKERIMRTQMDENGELWVSLSKDGKATRFNTRVLSKHVFNQGGGK